MEFEFCIQFVHHHPVLEMLLRGSKCLRPLQRRGLLGRCKRCKSLTGYACGILFARTFTAHRFTCNIDTKSFTTPKHRELEEVRLVKLALEARKKEKRFFPDGEGILPEYVQIAKELDDEFDKLLAEVKDTINNPDWIQYETEIQEAIEEIEEEVMSSTTPMTAAYRQQIEDNIEAVVHKITQKWIFIFKERREKKARELYLKQVDEELRRLKDKKEIEAIDKGAEQLLLEAKENPTGTEAKILAKVNSEFAAREKKLVEWEKAKVQQDSRLYQNYDVLIPYSETEPEDKSTWAGADRILAHIELREREKKFGKIGYPLELPKEDFADLQKFFDNITDTQKELLQFSSHYKEK